VLRPYEEESAARFVATLGLKSFVAEGAPQDHMLLVGENWVELSLNPRPWKAKGAAPEKMPGSKRNSSLRRLRSEGRFF
jgi:hypothetical protein